MLKLSLGNKAVVSVRQRHGIACCALAGRYNAYHVHRPYILKQVEEYRMSCLVISCYLLVSVGYNLGLLLRAYARLDKCVLDILCADF